MSAKPVKKQAARKTPEAESALASSGSGSGKARDRLDALNLAYAPEPIASTGPESTLPLAFWDQGPPLTIRARGGGVLFANAAYAELQDMLTEAEAEPSVEDLAAIIEGLGHPYSEELVLQANGGTRYFLARHSQVPIEGAATTGIASLYVPAERIGHRLASLQEADDRWHDLSRLVSDIVWECDTDTVITYLSPRVHHLLGYHPHDVVGRPWSFLAGENDRLSERLLDPERRQPFRGLELALVDLAGEQRTFLMQGLPVFDRQSGAFVGFRGTAQDLTDYVQHETALLKAVDAADTANRAKSEFLANMSHELRTPLNAIIGFTEIMAAEEFGPIGNPRYREYLDSVLESGRHLLNLINQVLDVAKIEAGRLQLIEDSVDPADLVNAALRVVAATAERRGVEVRADVDATHGHLWADEGKLRQILLNLLSNSIKFTPKGGQVEVRARSEADGSYLLQVRDTGIGIEPSQFETVLTPFEQIDSSLTRRFEGTGLGLPLCKALAEAHDGSLTLESTPGEGTCVSVRLPADRVRRT